MEVRVDKEHHPLRFMFKFLLFVGILYVVGRVVAEKKAEFYGITESEARVKIETKLGPKMGEVKAAELADQIIPKLMEKGVIVADEPHDIVDSAEASVGEAGTDSEE